MGTKTEVQQHEDIKKQINREKVYMTKEAKIGAMDLQAKQTQGFAVKNKNYKWQGRMLLKSLSSDGNLDFRLQLSEL